MNYKYNITPEPAQNLTHAMECVKNKKITNNYITDRLGTPSFFDPSARDSENRNLLWYIIVYRPSIFTTVYRAFANRGHVDMNWLFTAIDYDRVNCLRELIFEFRYARVWSLHEDNRSVFRADHINPSTQKWENILTYMNSYENQELLIKLYDLLLYAHPTHYHKVMKETDSSTRIKAASLHAIHYAKGDVDSHIKYETLGEINRRSNIDHSRSFVYQTLLDNPAEILSIFLDKNNPDFSCFHALVKAISSFTPMAESGGHFNNKEQLMLDKIVKLNDKYTTFVKLIPAFMPFTKPTSYSEMVKLCLDYPTYIKPYIEFNYYEFKEYIFLRKILLSFSQYIAVTQKQPHDALSKAIQYAYTFVNEDEIKEVKYYMSDALCKNAFQQWQAVTHETIEELNIDETNLHLNSKTILLFLKHMILLFPLNSLTDLNLILDHLNDSWSQKIIIESAKNIIYEIDNATDIARLILRLNECSVQLVAKQIITNNIYKMEYDADDIKSMLDCEFEGFIYLKKIRWFVNERNVWAYLKHIQALDLSLTNKLNAIHSIKDILDKKVKSFREYSLYMQFFTKDEVNEIDVSLAYEDNLDFKQTIQVINSINLSNHEAAVSRLMKNLFSVNLNNHGESSGFYSLISHFEKTSNQTASQSIKIFKSCLETYFAELSQSQLYELLLQKLNNGISSLKETQQTIMSKIIESNSIISNIIISAIPLNRHNFHTLYPLVNKTGFLLKRYQNTDKSSADELFALYYPYLFRDFKCQDLISLGDKFQSYLARQISSPIVFLRTIDWSKKESEFLQSVLRFYLFGINDIALNNTHSYPINNFINADILNTLFKLKIDWLEDFLLSEFEEKLTTLIPDTQALISTLKLLSPNNQKVLLQKLGLNVTSYINSVPTLIPLKSILEVDTFNTLFNQVDISKLHYTSTCFNSLNMLLLERDVQCSRQKNEQYLNVLQDNNKLVITSFNVLERVFDVLPSQYADRLIKLIKPIIKKLISEPIYLIKLLSYVNGHGADRTEKDTHVSKKSFEIQNDIFSELSNQIISPDFSMEKLSTILALSHHHFHESVLKIFKSSIYMNVNCFDNLMLLYGNKEYKLGYKEQFYLYKLVENKITEFDCTYDDLIKANELIHPSISNLYNKKLQHLLPELVESHEDLLALISILDESSVNQIVLFFHPYYAEFVQTSDHILALYTKLNEQNKSLFIPQVITRLENLLLYPKELITIYNTLNRVDWHQLDGIFEYQFTTSKDSIKLFFEFLDKIKHCHALYEHVLDLLFQNYIKSSSDFINCIVLIPSKALSSVIRKHADYISSIINSYRHMYVVLDVLLDVEDKNQKDLLEHIHKRAIRNTSFNHTKCRKVLYRLFNMSLSQGKIDKEEFKHDALCCSLYSKKSISFFPRQNNTSSIDNNAKSPIPRTSIPGGYQQHSNV